MSFYQLLIFILAKKFMYADKIVKVLSKTFESFNYKKKEDNPPFKIPGKTLIVLPPFIGDVVLLTPFIRNLRNNLGDKIPIDVVCNKNIHNLVETLPYIDHFYLNNNVAHKKTSFLKNNDYDTVFLLNTPILWAFASYYAKIKQRISLNFERIGLYDPPIWPNLITHVEKLNHIADKKPQWKVYLDILKDLGLEIFDEHIEIPLTNDDLYRAKKIMKSIERPRICVHITSKSHGKIWNFNNWITVLKRLKEKYNCNFIATGASEDKNIYDYLAVKSGVNIHNLCGNTTIRETIALYRYLDMVITIDTAPAHLAAAANTKNIIVIYGPTNEAQWIPYAPSSNIHQEYIDLPCRPCITRICGHKSCLNEITPDQIIAAVDKYLD